jgi:hypothetical protein
MLKDGSSEVWPEAVEKIFMEGTVGFFGDTFFFLSTYSIWSSFISNIKLIYLSLYTGLRQYWESPWATFSSGRSRWRNAYLVEYLQKAGIQRTKKQVASHIQVLRNMLKGEPGKCRSYKSIFLDSFLESERNRDKVNQCLTSSSVYAEFQLVAGADDLEDAESAGSKGSPTRHASGDGSDSESFPVSPSTPGSTGSFDDHFRLTATSDGAVAQHQSVKAEDFSDFLSIGQINGMPGAAARRASPTTSSLPYAIVSPPRTAPQLVSHISSSRLKSGMPQPPSPLGLHLPDGGLDLHAVAAEPAPASLYPGVSAKVDPNSVPKDSLLLRTGSAPVSAATTGWFAQQPRTLPTATVRPSCGSTNRVRTLSYWAEGMSPVGLDVDALMSATPASQRYAARTAFRISLAVPALDDLQCAPALHGFSAAVTLAAPWSLSASCQTVVQAGGVVKSDEIAELVRPVASSGAPALVACLPDSALSHCRWLESIGEFSAARTHMLCASC